MKSPAQFFRGFSWKSAGGWFRRQAVRTGIVLMYLVGAYLIVAAWFSRTWSRDPVVKTAATLIGAAVLVAALYFSHVPEDGDQNADETPGKKLRRTFARLFSGGEESQSPTDRSRRKKKQKRR